DDADVDVQLLANDVAENVAFFIDEILLGALEFLDYINRKNGESDELRMGMFERRAGGFAVVFENQDVLEAAVFLQVENAVAEGPEDVFDPFGREGGEAGVVVGGLDDDLMRADAVHLV